ncbi:NAD(P)/FAD-dependent oxidoreductase, partial [Aliarcobacter butzleri]
IGVETIARDGFRVFPVNHSSSIILSALDEELKRVGVDVECSVSYKSGEFRRCRITKWYY